MMHAAVNLITTLQTPPDTPDHCRRDDDSRGAFAECGTRRSLGNAVLICIGPHRIPSACDSPQRPHLAWLVVLALAVLAGLSASPTALGTQIDQGDTATDEQSILLDLSRKDTFVTLPLITDPQQVEIANVEVRELPSDHELVPASAVARLGQPLDIQLKEPRNVRIRLAVVKRGNEVALKVSPQIVLGRENAIELTRDRVTRTARNLQRRIKNLNQQLSAMARERERLHIWMLTPGNKPLAAVKIVRARMKLLDRAIRARQRDVPVTQSQCAALAQAGAFVEQLHKNVEIHYEVKLHEQIK